MLELELIRDTYSRDMGVFGKLSVFWRFEDESTDKLFECETVERPWVGNTPHVSCIPEGLYPLAPRRYYRKGYDAWEVKDVPGRSLILIHIANSPSDLEGCIGVGYKRGFVNGQWAVTNSAITFEKFMGAMGDAEEATLTVSQYRPFKEK